MFEKDKIEELMRGCLRQYFPLYDESHNVIVHFLDTEEANPQRVYVGYRTTKANIPTGTTHFDLNVEGEILYFLSVEIITDLRGKGHGLNLGRAIDEFGRSIGCRVLRTTPSGTTVKGEDKYVSFQRHGFKKVPGNHVELEKLL